MGPAHLNARVNDYLALATKAIDSDDRDLHHQLATTAADSLLLHHLDQIVAIYQKESEAKVFTIQVCQHFLTALLLVTVGVLIIFVFKPTTDLVSSNLSAWEDANTELTEFSYRVSHDLRAPLMSAIGVTAVAEDLILEKDLEGTREAISCVTTSLKRASATIDDILGLVKLRMTDEPVSDANIREMIVEAVAMMKDTPDGERVNFQITCDEDVSVKTRPVYIRQTIQNLVSNAVKYQDPDESQCDVRIQFESNEQGHHLSVSDNGLGIDEAYHPQLFSMFKRKF